MGVVAYGASLAPQAAMIFAGAHDRAAMTGHGRRRSVAVMAGHADRIDDGVILRAAGLFGRRIGPPHGIGMAGSAGYAINLVVRGIEDR